MKIGAMIAAAYAVIAMLLLNLPFLNKWLAIHAFYLLTWPVSDFLGARPINSQVIGGTIEWFLIGLIFASLSQRSKTRKQ